MVRNSETKSSTSFQTIDCIVIDDDTEEPRAGSKRKQKAAAEAPKTVEDDEVTFVCDMDLADTQPGPLSKKLKRLKLQYKPSDLVGKPPISNGTNSSWRVSATSSADGTTKKPRCYSPKHKNRTLPNVKVVHIYDTKPLEDMSAVLVRNEDSSFESLSNNSTRRFNKTYSKKLGNSSCRKKQSFVSIKCKNNRQLIKSKGEFVTLVKKKNNLPQHTLPKKNASVDTIDLIESDDEGAKTVKSNDQTIDDCERSIAGHVILKNSIEVDPSTMEQNLKKDCSIQTDFDDTPPRSVNENLNKVYCKPIEKILAPLTNIEPPPINPLAGLYKLQDNLLSSFLKQQAAPTVTKPTIDNNNCRTEDFSFTTIPGLSQEPSNEENSESIGLFPNYVIKSVINILDCNPIAVVTMNNKMWGFTKSVLESNKVSIQSQYLGEFVNNAPIAAPVTDSIPTAAEPAKLNLMYTSLSNYDVIIENPQPSSRTVSIPQKTSESDILKKILSSDNTPISSGDVSSENIQRETSNVTSASIGLNNSTSMTPIPSNMPSSDIFNNVFAKLENPEDITDDYEMSTSTGSTLAINTAANSELIKEEIDIENEILRLKNDKPLSGKSKDSTKDNNTKSCKVPPPKAVSPKPCVPHCGDEPPKTFPMLKNSLANEKAPESFSDSYASFCLNFCKDRISLNDIKLKIKTIKY